MNLSEQVGDVSTAWTAEFNARFHETDSPYGNKTYMDIYPIGYYDIRYDRNYNPGMSDGEHILYVLDFLINEYFRKTIEVGSVEARVKVDLDLGKED